MKDFKQGAQTGPLLEAGGRMGFMKGGQVKKMDSMDHSLVQRKKTDAADQRTAEFGDQPPVKANFRKGGRAGMPKTVKAKGGRAGMPKTVKSHGGKARKPYKGYNAQAGGSGNEDKRYMSAEGGLAAASKVQTMNTASKRMRGGKAHNPSPMYGK